MTSLAAAALALALEASSGASDPAGHWLNPQQTVVVEIAECGERSLCGWVRWASDKAESDASAAGAEPLVGTALFHQFREEDDGRWKGRLYVPDLRRTHKAELRMKDVNRLEVRGCAAARLICKSQIWTRTEPRTQGQ